MYKTSHVAHAAVALARPRSCITGSCIAVVVSHRYTVDHLCRWLDVNNLRSVHRDDLCACCGLALLSVSSPAHEVQGQKHSKNEHAQACPNDDCAAKRRRWFRLASILLLALDIPRHAIMHKRWALIFAFLASVIFGLSAVFLQALALALSLALALALALGLAH